LRSGLYTVFMEELCSGVYIYPQVWCTEYRKDKGLINAGTITICHLAPTRTVKNLLAKFFSPLIKISGLNKQSFWKLRKHVHSWCKSWVSNCENIVKSAGVPRALVPPPPFIIISLQEAVW
jgi:hypothetical protein